MLMGYDEYGTIFSREPAYISLDMLIFFQNKEIQTPFQFWILTLYFIHMLLIDALFSYICLPVVQWMIWWTSSVLRMIDIPEEVDELLSCECRLVTHILSVLLWTSLEALSQLFRHIFLSSFFSLLLRHWLLKFSVTWIWRAQGEKKIFILPCPILQWKKKEMY